MSSIKQFWRKKIILAGAIAGVGIFFFGYVVPVGKTEQAPLPPPRPEPVTGWLWSAHRENAGQKYGMGLISLNSQNDQAQPSACPEPQTQPCWGVFAIVDPGTRHGTIRGYGWSSATGWVCFGATCTEDQRIPADMRDDVPPGGGLVRAEIDPATGGINGWARAVNIPGNEGWIRLGGSPGYGLSISRATKEWGGYAWSGFTYTNPNERLGIGWLVPIAASGGIIIQPWVETSGGDIYSGTHIKGAAPVAPEGQANAEYTIQASGAGGTTIIDWVSSAGGNPPIIGRNVPAKPMPSRDTLGNYVSRLGRIDFSGLYSGQYGEVVNDPQQAFSTLDGKVFVISHDFLLSQLAQIARPWTLYAGAGTIIVKGNLTVDVDVRYASGGATDPRQIPSLAWIVLGDIHIDPSVTELAGTMIALGNNASVACAQNQAGCGQIFTGATDNPLVIKGSLFAKRFSFERTGRMQEQGSEKIVFDGRLLVNPPPGLGDLIKGLPVLKSGP